MAASDHGPAPPPALSPAPALLPAPAVPPAPVPAQAAALWSVLAVISAGGVAGALARYALGVAFPYSPGGLPWSTFGINVSGCLLIGVLMALVSDARRLHPLLRPFLGTGLLGGYTTFSSYIVEIQHLVAAGATRTALAYLAGTLISALAAVYAGTALTRLAVRGARRRRLAVRGRLAGRGRADVR